ncbi:MAG: hypothetical protein CSA54_02770 [Gammaproteobacteria bacterium]|nr:MAG: hypothetical protein CSA54_02770 [Gammaproteobacteria bacterium]
MLSTAAYAGGRASVEFLAHNLNLSDQQRVQVEGIMRDQHQQHKTLRKAGKANCEGKQKMWLQTRSRMYDVLSEKQLQAYDGLQKRRQRSCSPQVHEVAANKGNTPL